MIVQHLTDNPGTAAYFVSQRSGTSVITREDQKNLQITEKSSNCG